MTNSSTGDPMVGRALEGRYEITARLARGGMATVYRAVDRRLDRAVAVKVMHEGLGDDAEFARTFDREARAAALLSHPNIVSVFDQGIDFGRPYIVMELVEGSTLRRLISREAPLSPLRALDLIDPVLAALSAAHEAGLIHRDMKPENVLISRRGQLKVADFGLARAVTAQSAAASQGLLVGTVSYLPPELVEEGHADTRSDVYSAGIVLFEMLTGRKPHQGNTPIQVAYAHVHSDVPKPSSWVDTDWRTSLDGIPPYLDALVGAATSRDPEARPADARVFLDGVRRARKALSSGIMHDPQLTALLSDPNGAEDTIAVPAPAVRVRTTVGVASARPRPATPSAAPAPTPAEQPVEATPAGRPGTSHGGGDAEDSTGDVGWADSGALEIARDRRRRRIRRVLLGLTMILVVVLGAAGTWWMSTGRWVTAPTVTAMTQPEAAAEVKAAGLEIATTEEFSETVPAGEVMASVPGPGTRVARGDTITAVISKGPERVRMPATEGLGEAAAEQALSDARLEVGEVTRQWSESVVEGEVIGSSVGAGDAVRPGTAVDLVVSRGREPIEVTNWYNRKGSDAVASLASDGLRVVTQEKYSSDVAAGKVMGQTPNRGTLHRGDTVRLSISRGAEQVAVPDVTKKKVADATRTLEKAGFTVATKKAEKNNLGLGYVATQSVDPGKKAAKGSTITLSVV